MFSVHGSFSLSDRRLPKRYFMLPNSFGSFYWGGGILCNVFVRFLDVYIYLDKNIPQSVKMLNNPIVCITVTRYSVISFCINNSRIAYTAAELIEVYENLNVIILLTTHLLLTIRAM